MRNQELTFAEFLAQCELVSLNQDFLQVVQQPSTDPLQQLDHAFKCYKMNRRYCVLSSLSFSYVTQGDIHFHICAAKTHTMYVKLYVLDVSSIIQLMSH